VVSNFPVGHVEDSATLPIGVLAELNAMTGQLQLLEAPVRAASTEKLQ
jgi:muramoyltetrapeptide carboxypeptidase LdcA involved in peptidoglycan recycling